MSDFKVAVSGPGAYDLMHPSEQQIPVRIEWSGETFHIYYSADDYDAASLRATPWDELARQVASDVQTRYMYHADSAHATAFLAWLNDDPEDERLIAIQDAEEAWRYPGVVNAIRSALHPLGTDARRRALAEVSA